MTITVRNSSPFSFPQTQAVIELQHSFGVGKERMRLRFPLQAKNVTKMTFYVHADFCGSMEVTLKKIYVLDYLHLFRSNLRIRQKTTNILILPKRQILPVSNTAEAVFCADNDVFGDTPGDDPSEIFGLHEYVPGEPVSRIHWKLSIKEDQLLVKEFSTPVLKSVLLLLEFNSTQSMSYARIQEAEAILTLFYSAAYQMIEMQIIPTILWYDAELQQMESHQPAAIGQLTDVFRALYRSIRNMKMDVQKLINTVTGAQFSSATCITNSMSPALLKMMNRQLTANQKTMLIVCESDTKTDPVPEETTVLKVHPASMQEDIGQLVI